MTAVNRPKKRSPLRRSPLRNPGQSIEERIDEVQSDRPLLPLVGALFLVAVAALEWWRHITNDPPRPAVVSVLALLALAFVARRFFSVRSEIRKLRLGLDGEKFVAQYLEANRRDGWRLLNDLPGTGFNVDHVLVSPRGVFAIETKTVSKPHRGDAKVVFDGNRIVVNGQVPDRDPLVQARASRDWVRSILEDTTSRKFPVRGVVIYPGWYVERAGGARASEAWVLNERRSRPSSSAKRWSCLLRTWR